MSDWSAERTATLATGGTVMKLLDKHLEPIDDLHGFLEWEAPDTANEEGTFVATYPASHPICSTLLPFGAVNPDRPEDMWTALVHESQWVLIETTGGRLFYRVLRITDSQGSRLRGSTVKIEAISLHRYAAHITFQASPGDPLILQTKYRDLHAGDSLRVIKESFLVNTMREFQPGAITGWNLWTPAAWKNVIPTQWPCIVNPRIASTTTAATILDYRFDSGFEAVKETLNAAGLLLTMDVWLEGDPQPFPEFCTLTVPTIVLDVVPRQFDTSTTGGVGDLLTGLVRSFDTTANAPRLGLAETTSTAAGVRPWVVWRPEHMAGVTSEFTVAKSELWHVTVGGRSPEALNKLVGSGAKAIFGGLGAAVAAAFPPYAALAAAAGAFLGDVVGEGLKGKLFAWTEFQDAKRRDAHGRFAWRDKVGAGDGWTIEAFQQGFQMLAQGAGAISIGFKVAGSAPFEWGRDYRAGDQQGLEHRQIIFATYVATAKIGQKRGDTSIRSTIELGDPRVRENSVALLNRSVKSLKNASDRIKTFIM